MYLPPHFAATDPEALHALMRAYPLGTLITHGEGGLDANHLPFEFDADEGEHGILRAAEGYISPNWYPSKQAHHKQVPTWNYAVVHAHGRIRVRDDARFGRSLLATLTRTHEAAEPRPWKRAEAPRDYIEAMVQAVVGQEIEIGRLVGKFKLSQNKEVGERLGAAMALGNSDRASRLVAMSARVESTQPLCPALA